MAANNIPFQSVVDALLDGRGFPPAYLRYFSDIDPASLELLVKAWPGIKPERKLTLLDQLELTAEDDTLVSFDDFARFLLTDPDAAVRTGALRLLNECEDPKLVPAIVRILESDEAQNTRAEAAAVLGDYCMLGELEEIPEKTYHLVVDALLRVAGGEDAPNVRRRALESLGYSSRTEVVTLIESAFNRQDPEWKTSALVAMGRSSDDRWQDHVLQMIVNENPRVRLAAVQAAGELALAPARSILIGMLAEEDEEDITGAAIWSLSQIGGEDVRTLFESLIDQAEDDDAVAFLEEALENLTFTEDLERFDLMSLDPDDFDEDDEEDEDDEDED